MRVLILAFGLVGFGAFPAVAAEVEFSTVDADGSELVSVEEVEAAGLELSVEDFAAADADGDEYLNAEEFAAAVAEMP